MPIQPTTARARARVEMTNDIKVAAHRQLVEVGPDGVSLRAVARELGVVSSAVYRYFASRDELLTALIIDGYDAVGAVAEHAAAASVGRPVGERWALVARSVRAWSLAHPHDYALVYGSPVPGYQAPADTVSPALRVTVAAMTVVAEGVEAGEIDVTPTSPVARPVHADFTLIRAGMDIAIPDEVMARAIAAWTGLLGHISYELFGHLHNGITDYDAFFEHQLDRTTRGLVGAG
ncbi:TetR/AcrR family transcriptional regulator [Aquihabitans sp. McL0605]|uniref:TetR/AcrR family transcriptional regulator n=1 Tax=Aquihabitans sp. McL0605 TaxID=3415671 RepID=UPI003CF67512